MHMSHFYVWFYRNWCRSSLLDILFVIWLLPLDFTATNELLSYVWGFKICQSYVSIFQSTSRLYLGPRRHGIARNLGSSGSFSNLPNYLKQQGSSVLPTHVITGSTYIISASHWSSSYFCGIYHLWMWWNLPQLFTYASMRTYIRALLDTISRGLSFGLQISSRTAWQWTWLLCGEFLKHVNELKYSLKWTIC